MAHEYRTSSIRMLDGTFDPVCSTQTCTKRAKRIMDSCRPRAVGARLIVENVKGYDAPEAVTEERDLPGEVGERQFVQSHLVVEKLRNRCNHSLQHQRRFSLWFALRRPVLSSHG